MELAHRWSDRNLTKIELIVSLLILSLLIGAFSHYMFDMFAKVEQRMVEKTVININTALYYRASMLIMQRKYTELEALLHINPMKELQSNLNINEIQRLVELDTQTLSAAIVSTPSNYGGEIFSDYLNNMDKGKWYYVIDNKILIYLPNNKINMKNSKQELSEIRFQIKFDYVDNNLNGVFEEDIDEYNSISLKLANLN